MGPKVTKQYITILPNKNYANLSGIRASSLKENEIIQYGYIKIRDLQKWNNDEVVSVKMGQLTPSAYSYIGMSVVNAACNRIEQQDTTALFDDEDELIPVYVFVSTLTDIEWRGYLRCHGYCSSRKNVQREGIRISKSQLIAEYEKKFGKTMQVPEQSRQDENNNEEEHNFNYGSAVLAVLAASLLPLCCVMCNDYVEDKKYEKEQAAWQIEHRQHQIEQAKRDAEFKAEMAAAKAADEEKRLAAGISPAKSIKILEFTPYGYVDGTLDKNWCQFKIKYKNNSPEDIYSVTFNVVFYDKAGKIIEEENGWEHKYMKTEWHLTSKVPKRDLNPDMPGYLRPNKTDSGVWHRILESYDTKEGNVFPKLTSVEITYMNGMGTQTISGSDLKYIINQKYI